MKKKIILLSFHFFLLLPGCQDSCSTKAHLMRSSQELLEQVRQAELNYNSAEWDSYDRQLRQLVRNCYPLLKAEMDLLDKKDFWMRIIQYHYYRYGLGIWRQLMGNQGLGPFIREQIAEWSNSVQSFIRDTLKDFVQKNRWEQLRRTF